MICEKCKEELQLKKTKLTYLDHQIIHELLCCPSCGQVFVPEELASGRMREVETLLEDK